MWIDWNRANCHCEYGIRKVVIRFTNALHGGADESIDDRVDTCNGTLEITSVQIQSKDWDLKRSCQQWRPMIGSFCT